MILFTFQYRKQPTLPYDRENGHTDTMIISTVNFVNNYKFSDFILDKITEEQKVRDEELKKANKRHSLCLATSPKVR